MQIASAKSGPHSSLMPPSRRDHLSGGTNHLKAKSISDKLYESNITPTQKSKSLNTLKSSERDNQEYDWE